MAVSLLPRWVVALGLVLATSCCTLAVQIPFLHRYEPVEYDLAHLSRQQQRIVRSTSEEERTLNLQFIAMGRSFDLVLVPDTSLFHKRLTVSSSSGSLDTTHIRTSTFTGYDRNTPGSHVHGNTIAGVFGGTIYTSNETYYIEPAHRYTRDTTHHSIVYRHSDINMEALQGARCGVSDSSMVGYLQRAQWSTPEETVRETRQSPGPRNRNRVRCDLSITGDFRFFQEVTNMNMPESARVSMATSLLVSYVQGASRIFQNTNFDDDGSTTDNIHFGIRNLTVETRDAPRFRSEFIGVEAFLDLHSEADTSSFCLSYRITSRDFNNGVLGLAYVAKSNTAGGICEPSLNTGIVTIVNYNQKVPTVVTVLTLAHEAGHNFGSEHDPDDTVASVCSPGGNDGNFIMYPFANSGTRRNNNDFSSCSRAMMDVFIATRGQQDSEDCFSAADDLCENGLLDDGEDCDCGIQYDATTKVCDDDPCCNGTTCLLVNSTDSVNRTECSPDQGVCCSEACLYLNTSVPCAPETECAQATNCNDNSSSCPEPEAQIPTGGVDYILCNDGTATCVDNVCNGSFCVVLNADSCVCNKTDEICDVCCMVGGECVSTITLAAENGSMADLLPGGMGQRFPVGTPCNNFNGYCDTLHNCFQVDSEGALDRISSLFSSTNINVVIDFVTEKWWAVLIAVVGMLAGFFVLVLIIHLLLPRPEHVKHRSQRRQTIRRQRMQSRSHGGGHGHEMKMQY